MLEVKNLDVTYGKIQVIWNLSLNIGNNEVVGIMIVSVWWEQMVQERAP